MKKGFTIIELLITIAIIGIISTMIIFSYKKITDINYQKIYDAKVKEIETAALKYAENNLNEIKKKTSESITVKDLIVLGYLEGDSEDKLKLLDPRRNKDYIDGNVLIYFEGKNVHAIFNVDAIAVKLTQDTSNLTTNQIKLKADITIPEKMKMEYCVYELNDLKGYYSSFTSGKLYGNDCNNYTFNNIKYFIDVINGKPVLTHTATIKVYDNFGREIKQSITARVKEEKIDETIEVDAYYATNYPIIKTKYDNKWTNQNIILIPNIKNGITYEYSLDLFKWNNLPSSGYIQSEPGNEYPVYLRKIINGVIGNSIGVIKTKIDRTPPTLNSLANSSNGAWTKSSVDLNAKYTDNDSGLKRIEYSYNQVDVYNDIAQPTSGINTFTSKGTWSAERNATVYYRAVDVVGNTSGWSSGTNVKIDKTPPTLNSLTNSSGGSWTKSSVELNASYTDNNSGLNKIEYSYNKSDVYSDITQPPSGTTTFSSKGTWSADRNATVYYRAVDTVGNTSGWSSGTNIKIDNTAPTLNSISNSSNGSWTKSNVLLSASYTDGASGLRRIEYTYNKSSVYSDITQPASGTTTFSSSGTWSAERNSTVYFRAVDVLGNTSGWSSGTYVKIDKTAPTITYASSCSPTTGNVFCTTFNITDTLSNQVNIYRTHCGENSKIPDGNANYCNSTNLSVKTRIERYKADIPNPPDNKSTINVRSIYPGVPYGFSMSTQLGAITYTNYGFIICDLAGNCSPTTTFRCTKTSC